jgi:hypothetical protein
MVLVNGIWLRRIGDKVQVLVDRGEGRWHVVIEERADGAFSHCVHPTGINRAPVAVDVVCEA